MDDFITMFVQTSYTEAAQEDIFQALGIFQVFNYLDPYPKIENILTMESYLESSDLVDGFTSIILTSQEYLLDRHGITLSGETTLAFNNIVLRTLYLLQKLEDPVPILTILETMESREYKMCEILAHLSSTPITTFLQLVDEVRPSCLELLAEFLYKQEDGMQVSRGEIPGIKEQVKIFKEVFGINPAVRVILDSDTVMGEDFSLYRPLFDELREVVEDETVLVETLLFLLLYSRDGNAQPISTFEAHSDYLVSDLTASNRLGTTLASMYTKMQRHKEQMKNEKK